MNRVDSLAAFVPVLFAGVLYFAIVNLVKTEKQLLFVLGSLILGAVLSSILAIFTYLKIYLLPFPYTHVEFFTTFGSLLDQAMYFALVLPIAAYFTYNLVVSLTSNQRRKEHASVFAMSQPTQVARKMTPLMVFFAVSFVIIVASFAITVIQVITLVANHQLPILPYEIGLQTAFAAISQDSSHVLKSFVLGSGIGTYLVDFTRFKPAIFNSDSNLWSFIFFRSSSYVLELLATTGILGIVSFLFLVYRILREDRTFVPLLLAIIAAILLPFSFTLVALFFILLGILAVTRIHSNPEKYAELDLYLVAFKRGLVKAIPDGEHAPRNDIEKKYGQILPIAFFVLLLVVVGVPMFYTAKYVISDFMFQKSLVALSENKGLDAYNLQVASIQVFPYRDIYYRSFSQTNLALANAFAQQQSSKPSTEAQQNIVTLIQQSINSARNATSMAPMTPFNWNNLSVVYRSLIGFGQNADQFTVLTLQQAIALDTNNPQQYVELGGVYYQLGKFDDAIRQFQIAINLKNDYPNAYYNLGHAYEEKGDFQSALSAYEAVKTLVAKDSDNSKKISADIENLKNRMNGQQDNKDKSAKGEANASQSGTLKPAAEENQGPIDVNKPTTTLPERNPKVKIPGPTVSPAEKDSGTTTASPTPGN